MHEWSYLTYERPKTVLNNNKLEKDRKEPIKNLVTWVYEEGSYVPTAKITEKGVYSIISDYLGRPVQAFDSNDKLVWNAEYDIYGKIKMLVGNKRSIPFRQLGQYEDSETELYYNRYRYYDFNTGGYISKDPIGLAGNNPNLYTYVKDSNFQIDTFGLTVWGESNMDFNTWFNQASVKDILDNKSSVEAALRSPGGMHEKFPVAMAAKAKELGFTAEELKGMTVETKKITFVDVPDGKGGLLSGKHHSSSASSIFHSKLMNELKDAKTKGEAMDIINKHHEAHMRVSYN